MRRGSWGELKVRMAAPGLVQAVKTLRKDYVVLSVISWAAQGKKGLGLGTEGLLRGEQAWRLSEALLLRYVGASGSAKI